jgi:hypothetical protein
MTAMEGGHRPQAFLRLPCAKTASGRCCPSCGCGERMTFMFFGGRHLKRISRSERTRSRGGPAKFLAIVCLLGLAFPAPASSGPGYLRSVGPAPLRFWSPPKRTPEPAATNATPTADNEPMVPNPNPYNFMDAFGAQPPVTMEATSTSGSAPTAPVMPATAPNANVNGSSTAQPGDVVSPQMLLEYFPNGNNNNNRKGGQTSVYVPVDPNAVINHTQQPPPPRSSATYSN